MATYATQELVLDSHSFRLTEAMPTKLLKEKAQV